MSLNYDKANGDNVHLNLWIISNQLLVFLNSVSISQMQLWHVVQYVLIHMHFMQWFVSTLNTQSHWFILVWFETSLITCNNIVTGLLILSMYALSHAMCTSPSSKFVVQDIAHLECPCMRAGVPKEWVITRTMH